MHRFFVNKEDISGDCVILSGENANHAAVLRLNAGEESVACDGAGTDYFCAAAEKGGNVGKILRIAANLAEPPLAITLFQALPKGDKLAEIVEKCVEAGAAAIVPVATARCIAKPSGRDDKKTARLRKIAEAAAKQSGRGVIPHVGGIMPFKEAVAAAKNHSIALVCYENEKQRTAADFLKNMGKAASLALFIGPEGGFAPEEAAMFSAANITAITLGPRILRTENAGMAAIANILCLHELFKREEGFQ